MTNRATWFKVLGVTAILAVLIVDGHMLNEAAGAQRRGGRGGGARMGGAHRMHSARPQYRGSTRSRGYGSVRYNRPNSVRRSYTRPSSRARHSGAHRPPANRTGNRSSRNRSAIVRTPNYGSIGGRSDVTRSFAERNRTRRADDPSSLRDMARRPADGARPGRPGEPDRRPPGWEDRREQRQERRGERRDRLSEGAIWYGRGGYGYFWDDYYWWAPYYYGDQVVYVEVYPPESVEVGDLPDGVEEITTEDGETLYRYNGVYYRKTETGYVVVPAPGTGGELDPVTIVRRACDFIMQQQAMALTIADTMDHVQDSGQKILSHATRTIQLSRPAGLAAVAQGDDLDRRLWFDGETMTIVDRLENIYAQTKGPRTNDDMLDLLVEQLSVSLPLIDWFYSDPYATIADALQDGEYLGLMDLDGASCHHLSFSLDDADWQLWVDAGEDPVPRRLAITYTSAPEHPTYTARIESWQASPQFAEGTFRAEIPEGTRQIPFSTPQAEVDRLKDELEELRDANRRVDEYIASTKTITLYSQIAEKPDAAARIAAEQKRLAEIGEVSQDEIDEYLEKKRALQADLTNARRVARDS